MSVFKKNTANTDGDETQLFKVDTAAYRRRKLDNENTASFEAVRPASAPKAAKAVKHKPVGSQPVDYDSPEEESTVIKSTHEYASAHKPGSYGQSRNEAERRERADSMRRSGDSYFVEDEVPSRPQTGTPRRQAQVNAPRRQTRKVRKRSGITRVLKTVLMILLLAFVIYSVLVIVSIFRMNRVHSSERQRTAEAMYSQRVTNVLLIGTDSRDPEEDPGRSDSIMLLSLDSASNKLTMTSFLRDTYVEIPGYGSGKLNSAYSKGGADLLMDTLEQNFNIRLDSYFMVTFKGFVSVVDAVGGVKIDVSDEEAEAINTILKSDINEICGDDINSDLLSGGGRKKLNGKQALAYSRIRYVGNADFERTERQREVMSKVVRKLGTLNPFYLTAAYTNAVPYVTTNMDPVYMYVNSLRVPTLLFCRTEKCQIPKPGTFDFDTINGESVISADMEENQQILREMLFGEE